MKKIDPYKIKPIIIKEINFKNKQEVENLRFDIIRLLKLHLYEGIIPPEFYSVIHYVRMLVKEWPLCNEKSLHVLVSSVNRELKDLKNNIKRFGKNILHNPKHIIDILDGKIPSKWDK